MFFPPDWMGGGGEWFEPPDAQVCVRVSATGMLAAAPGLSDIVSDTSPGRAP